MRILVHNIQSLVQVGRSAQVGAEYKTYGFAMLTGTQLKNAEGGCTSFNEGPHRVFNWGWGYGKYTN